MQANTKHDYQYKRATKGLCGRNFSRAEQQVKSLQKRTVQCRPSLVLKSVQRMQSLVTMRSNNGLQMPK